MAVIKSNCQSCGAVIEVDTNEYVSKCPSCGFIFENGKTDTSHFVSFDENDKSKYDKSRRVSDNNKIFVFPTSEKHKTMKIKYYPAYRWIQIISFLSLVAFCGVAIYMIAIEEKYLAYMISAIASFCIFLIFLFLSEPKRKILWLIKNKNSLSFGEICKQSGISRGKVIEIVTYLIEDGYLNHFKLNMTEERLERI